MPEFIQLGDTSLVSPELHILDEDESDVNEYMLDPSELCAYQSSHESKFGGPGSIVNFWELSAHMGFRGPSYKEHYATSD